MFFKAKTGVTIEHSGITSRDSQWWVGASQRHDPVCQRHILRCWRVYLHGQSDGCAGDRLRRRGKKVLLRAKVGSELDSRSEGRGFEYWLIQY